MKRGKPDQSRVMQRFSMAMARANDIEYLIASMLAAIVVSMDELTPAQKKEVKRLVDGDYLRVLY